MMPGLAAVLIGGAFLVGAALGIGSAVAYWQFVGRLDQSEREWKRRDWLLRLDRRRAARRRFIENIGRASW